MATIVGSAASNVSKSSRGIAIQVTFPAITGAASGDTAYLFHACDGGLGSSVPSGWTEIDLDNATSTDWLVASRVITGDSDYTSLDAGFIPGQGWTSIIVLVRGSHTLEAFANDNDGSAIAYVPQITGFSSGDLSVIHGTADDQQVTMTPPTGWTLFQNDDGTDGTNLSSAGLAYKVSAGGTEGQTTPGSGDEWSGPSSDGCASFHIRFSGIDDPDAGGTTFERATVFAGSSTVTVAPNRVKSTTVAISATGSLVVAPNRAKTVSTAFAATGTLTTTPEAAAVVKLASTVFAGSSSMAALSNRVRAANTAFAGSGVLTTVSNRVKNTATVTAGTGTLTTVSTTVRVSSTAFAGTSSLTTKPAGAPISVATSFAGAGSLTVRATVVRVRTTSVAATSTATTVPRLVQVRTTSSGAVSALNTVPIRVSPRTTVFGGRSSLRANPRRVRSSTTRVDGVGRLITRGVSASDGTGRVSVAALSRNVLTINVTNPNTAAVVSPGLNRAVLTGQTPTRAN